MCMKLCKEKRVKIKDGRMILIRRPRMADVKQLKDYINSLVDEDAPIQINKRMSLKAEHGWVENSLKKIRSGDAHLLVAELNDRIVGVVNLTKGSGRLSHVAEYGISVNKNYRRLGIAKELTKYILKIGKNDRAIRVITLRVYELNTGAIKLYKKLGFRKVAKLERRIQYKGKLVNEFIMDLVE
jgi:RimJ/RimL family protein N-acetyltransferase